MMQELQYNDVYLFFSKLCTLSSTVSSSHPKVVVREDKGDYWLDIQIMKTQGMILNTVRLTIQSMVKIDT